MTANPKPAQAPATPPQASARQAVAAIELSRRLAHLSHDLSTAAGYAASAAAEVLRGMASEPLAHQSATYGLYWAKKGAAEFEALAAEVAATLGPYIEPTADPKPEA